MNIDLDALDDGGGDDGGAPAWMATFSDLATLLLTFFVLLLSFAEMDVIEFREMLGSVRNAFGTQTEVPGHIEALNTTPIEWHDTPSSPIIALDEKQSSALREIRRFVRQREMQNDVEVAVSERGVVVRLKDSIAFATGSDQLNEGVKPVLDLVGELVVEFPEGLTIEGHTDDRPIRSDRFPSNWELSTARATAVLRHVQRDGPLKVQRLRVAGYADTEPLVPNSNEDNRARNRRVEFIFDRSAKRARKRRTFRDLLGAAARGSQARAPVEADAGVPSDVEAAPPQPDRVN